VYQHLRGPFFYVFFFRFTSSGWGNSILPSSHARKKATITAERLLPSVIAFARAFCVKSGGMLIVVCLDLVIDALYLPMYYTPIVKWGQLCQPLASLGPFQPLADSVRFILQLSLSPQLPGKDG